MYFLKIWKSKYIAELNNWVKYRNSGVETGLT